MRVREWIAELLFRCCLYSCMARHRTEEKCFGGCILTIIVVSSKCPRDMSHQIGVEQLLGEPLT